MRIIILASILSLLWTPSIFCTLNIRREQLDQQYCPIMEEFCFTKDYFENPLRTELFCSARNALCSGRECEECVCQEEGFENFISYTFGCMSYEHSKKLITGDTDTFPPSYEPWNSAALESTGDIPYLNLQRNPSFMYKYVGYCTVHQLELINEETSDIMIISNQGRLLKVNRKTGVGGQFYYRVECNVGLNQCKRLFDGKVGKVDITCVNYNAEGKVKIKMAVLGKGDGVTTLNVPTDIPKVKKPESNNSSHFISVKSLPRTSNDSSSEDTFQNTYTKDKETFCRKLNATCAALNVSVGNSSSTCAFCRCAKNSLFVSFVHGCQTSSHIRNLFKNGTMIKDASLVINKNKTFQLQAEEEIPSIGTDYFMFGTCIPIKQEASSRHCNITKISSVDAVEGRLLDDGYQQQQSFELMSLSRIGGESLYCLKCQNFTCDLTRFSSLVMKIQMECTASDAGRRQSGRLFNGENNEDDKIRFSIMFKFTGQTFVNATAFGDIFEEKEIVVPTTANVATRVVTNFINSEKSKPWFKSTTVIGIISSLVVLLILAISMLVYCRKKYLRKKRTRCGHHYISDERDGRDEDDNITFVQLKGKSNKYSEVAILSQRKTQEQENVTLQGKENLYYQTSSEMHVKINSLYTQNEISQPGYQQNENDIYGLEYDSLHGKKTTRDNENDGTYSEAVNPSSSANTEVIYSGIENNISPQSQVIDHLYATNKNTSPQNPLAGNLYAMTDQQLSPQSSATENMHVVSDEALSGQYMTPNNLLSPQSSAYHHYEETEPENLHLYGRVSDMIDEGKYVKSCKPGYDTPKALRRSQLKDVKPMQNQIQDSWSGNLDYGNGQNDVEPYYGNMDTISPQ